MKVGWVKSLTCVMLNDKQDFPLLCVNQSVPLSKYLVTIFWRYSEMRYSYLRKDQTLI
jgi:hypothetical protein